MHTGCHELGDRRSAAIDPRGAVPTARSGSQAWQSATSHARGRPAREATTGRVTEASVKSVTTTFAYTPFGEVASAVTKDGSNSLLDLAFTYDVLGRIVTKTDTKAAPTGCAGWGCRWTL